MSAPSMVQRSGDALIVRSVVSGHRLYASDAPDSDHSSETELPQCKIKRNYNCTRCTFFTHNPRAHLQHLRDVHDERMRIYDCPHCVYASRHHQKLSRHIRMVHDPSHDGARSTPSPLAADAADFVEVQDTVEVDATVAESMAGSHRPLDLRCSLCSYTTASRAAYAKHGSKQHGSKHTPLAKPTDLTDSTKFYPCDKCNYVTDIRSRYTKHVKYHSMPMIKCALCDFRTPYKWNLDRHMRNHGGGGAFNCSVCNFTADIKQSLTVHEMNHHTPPACSTAPAGTLVESARGPRRRKGDAGGYSPSPGDADDIQNNPLTTFVGSDLASIEIVRKQNVCLSIDKGGNEDEDKYKVEINYANPRYICRYCVFEAVSETQLNEHENTHAGLVSRKLGRPIPNLIPLHTQINMLHSTGTSPIEPPLKKFKDMLSITNTEIDLVTVPSSTETTPSKASEDGMQRASNPCGTKEILPKKKQESFFDKLKERLLTETGEIGSLICKNCKFQSKCLSEHSVHEKTCTIISNKLKPSNGLLTSSGSTRCQNCRHRCKSSADLYIHLQTCKANSNVVQVATVMENALSNTEVKTNEKSLLDKSQEPHPMENVVFVWNTTSQNGTNEQEVNNAKDISATAELSIEIDNVDTSLDEIHCPSPNKAFGKKVFKCPHCAFWATTASRFHVHIVGHLNKKPFECSMCMYRSNWRWDITKHIRLKSAKDPEHGEAQVLMTDETGRRNYTKYNKYMTVLSPNHPKFHPSMLSKQVDDSICFSEEEASDCSVTKSIDHCVNGDSSLTITALPMSPPKNVTKTMESTPSVPIPEIRKGKKTFWKCKKCDYRQPTKEALLQHVKEQHSRSTQHSNVEVNPKSEKSKDTENSQFQVYRCGHCNQLSAWKHVIQRHCRLKHNGDIQVIATDKPVSDIPLDQTKYELQSDWLFPKVTPAPARQSCSYCPFTCGELTDLQDHLLQHTPSEFSIFKCYFCQYFVKTESELIEHLPLHGISDPEEYFSKVLDGRTAITELVNVQNSNTAVDESVVAVKKFHCSHCPYETNSKSQFNYHEQFHGRSDSTSYMCELCDYSVTKRHLLNQHMKVHGFATSARTTADGELPLQPSVCYVPDLDAVPHVWVAARNEFHKMYKCRFCSYVNSQRAKIPDHERIHCITFENRLSIFKCLECKYTTDNPVRLTDHSKKHGEIYGKIYSSVKSDIPDEEQIKHLRGLLEQENKDRADKMFEFEKGEKDCNVDQYNSDVEKILMFCGKCPARFSEFEDWKGHDECHESQNQFTCQVCSYSVMLESELHPHRTVHTEDYQSDTKLLLAEHSTHSCYPQPKIMMVVNGVNSAEPVWIAVPDTASYENSKKDDNINFRMPNKQYACDICPAKFFKTAALSYHLTLHGGDGSYKCRKCDYAVKTIGNVVKHEMVHDKSELSVQINYDTCEDTIYQSVPISGTDLFQRKTEAERRETSDSVLLRPNEHFPPVLQADPQFGFLMHGNPDFIYPKYIKNGREKEKRYKCHKCPSAFEKREQYKVHLSLHGSKQRYKCEVCDYSVKYYANYVQHMRKHQMNADAQAARSQSKAIVKTEPEDADTKKGKNVIESVAKSPYTDNDQQAIKILQRRRSNVINNLKDLPVEDKRYLYCPHCPYLSPRRDALENHLRRHRAVSGAPAGTHDCLHCDYSAPQAHFLRDHVKVHFNLQKHQLPDCFVKTDHTTLIVTEMGDDRETTKINLLKRKGDNIDVKTIENKIYVNARTGEIVQEQII